MLFGYNLIDKTMDEHFVELATMARDPKTLILLDTNILAYLYKLHEAARREFFTWTDLVVQENRLKIPAWSAGEYLSRVTSRSLQSYTPKNKDPDQPKKALEAMLETAAMFVDETVLLSIDFAGSRNEFLTKFKNAVDALPKFTSAFKHQFNPEKVHEEIQTHLSRAILSSDVVDLCARAAREGDVRIEHRLPSAFRDADKDQNRFGDLIIWYEILQHSKDYKEDFHNVLFVTNDEKSDWVYAPQRRIQNVRGVRKQVRNEQSELKLIDPRLTAEFERVVGHQNVAICSLHSLIEGFSKDNAQEFGQLAAAIQINVEEISTLPTPLEESYNEGGNDEEPSEVEALADPDRSGGEAPVVAGRDDAQIQPAEDNANEPQLTYGPDALRDGEYESDAPLDINEIIRSLKSRNWYTQNAAVLKIKGIREQDFTPSSWFVLGRNIYQAACGNALKAMDFVGSLDSQLSRFPPDTAQHLLAGMLHEIYFSSNGEFRNEPKAYLLESPLRLVATAQYSTVRAFILHHLQAYLGRLKFRPGDSRSVILRLVSAPTETESNLDDNKRYELRSAQLDGVELILEQTVDQEEDIWARDNIQNFTADTLVKTISLMLAIPRWAITREFEPPLPPDAIFVIPERRTLRVIAALPDPV